MSESCCAPGAGRDRQAGAEPAVSCGSPPSAAADVVAVALVPLAGGFFIMGTDGRYGYGEDGEGPAHEGALSPFWISRYAVTNAQFAAFVEATGHRTEAEVFGWSFVFAGFLPDDFPP